MFSEIRKKFLTENHAELNWMRRGSTVIKMTDLSDLPARRIIIYYDLLLPSFWAKTKGG